LSNPFFVKIQTFTLHFHKISDGYLQTYIERDVRALINLKDLRPFQQFLALLAGRIGQIINYASLSNDVGVSATTIKSWNGPEKFTLKKIQIFNPLLHGGLEHEHRNGAGIE
jgi:hypothetical protein